MKYEVIHHMDLFRGTVHKLKTNDSFYQKG